MSNNHFGKILPTFKIILNQDSALLLQKLSSSYPLTIGSICEIRRGVLFDKKLLTTEPTNANSHPYFEGDVYPDIILILKQLNLSSSAQKCQSILVTSAGSKVRVFSWRRLVNRQQRIMGSMLGNRNRYY